jgi:hypothetical protein
LHLLGASWTWQKLQTPLSPTRVQHCNQLAKLRNLWRLCEVSEDGIESIVFKIIEIVGDEDSLNAKRKRVQLLSAIASAPSKKSVRLAGLKRTGAMAGAAAILKLGQKYLEALHK